MEEHCTIGLVVTTDGTVTDIPRCDYVEAENRAITDMQKTGKPFLVIINSQHPTGSAAIEVQHAISQNFGVTPFIADCQALSIDNINDMIQKILRAKREKLNK